MVWERGERRVNVAVEVRRWNVASSMNLGGGLVLPSSLSGSEGSGSSEGLDGGGGWFGFGGVGRWGGGRSRRRRERARPRFGWVGSEAEWVRRERVRLGSLER